MLLSPLMISLNKFHDFVMFSHFKVFYSLFPQAWPHFPCSQPDWWILNSAMKLFSSTVVSLDTQFVAVFNCVYQHRFHIPRKLNTVECMTLIYICHRCCNNDSRPDTAPGGGGKWASSNLQVWNKLVTSILKLAHLGLNKWPTLSRWHFQMKCPQ